MPFGLSSSSSYSRRGDCPPEPCDLVPVCKPKCVPPKPKCVPRKPACKPKCAPRKPACVPRRQCVQEDGTSTPRQVPVDDGTMPIEPADMGPPPVSAEIGCDSCGKKKKKKACKPCGE